MLKINPTIFRAYDIRGIYPQDLNESAAYRAARALLEFYPHAQTFVVAQDPRLSSPALTNSIIQGIVEGGRDVIDIGIAPDPLFYFVILHYGYDGGVVVSGSHNSQEYNGFTLNVRKALGKEPEDIILDDLLAIKKRVFSAQPFSESAAKGTIKKIDFSEQYVDYVAAKIKLKRPLKVIIDTANGACGYLPEKVFRKLGCQVKTLFGDFDGNFPNHLPDPYEEKNLSFIKEAVLQEKADIGFAFDTDGDRVAPIDNQGRQVLGDFCWLMLARQALKKKKGPLVHCMRISQAFLDEMKQQGIKTYFSVSHHSAVHKKIIETNAVFGGETTYHYLFPLDYYLCDEALFSALKLVEIVAEKDNFAQYVDSLPRYFASPEIFIATPDEEKEGLIKKLQGYLRENNYDFIDVDGARINFEQGWALARFANTSPYIKCRFEGKTKKDLKEIERKCLEIFKTVGIPITDKIYQELGF